MSFNPNHGDPQFSTVPEAPERGTPCEFCVSISDPYDHFPACAECNGRVCPACIGWQGDDKTVCESWWRSSRNASERQRGDDDGVEYGDPRDYLEERLLD